MAVQAGRWLAEEHGLGFGERNVDGASTGTAVAAMRAPIWVDIVPSAVLQTGQRLEVEGGGELPDLAASLERQLGLTQVCSSNA